MANQPSGPHTLRLRAELTCDTTIHDVADQVLRIRRPRGPNQVLTGFDSCGRLQDPRLLIANHLHATVVTENPNLHPKIVREHVLPFNRTDFASGKPSAETESKNSPSVTAELRRLLALGPFRKPSKVILRIRRGRLSSSQPLGLSRPAIENLANTTQLRPDIAPRSIRMRRQPIHNERVNCGLREQSPAINFEFVMRRPMNQSCRSQKQLRPLIRHQRGDLIDHRLSKRVR